MKARNQRLLAVAAAAVIVAPILYGLAKAAFLNPAADLDALIAQKEKDIRTDANALGMAPGTVTTLLADPNRYPAKPLERETLVARKLNVLYRRSLNSNEIDAGEAILELLTGTIAPSGLNERFSSDPGQAQRLPKSKDSVVSRTISLKGGKLSNAVNLLYLLAEEPHVHRFDTLKLTPSKGERGKVDLMFTYSMLVMAAPKGLAAGATQAATQLALPSLDSQKRGFYKIIEERDIFRPYVKRPEPTPPPSVAAAPQPTPPPSQQDRRQVPEEERWRVCGLSMIGGVDVVHVRHVQSQETRMYKVGQILPMLDGKIVLIDTRMLRRFDNSKMLSDARLILRMKDTFWAVENGDMLAQKHRLNPAEMPSQLLSPTTAPAGVLSHKD